MCVFLSVFLCECLSPALFVLVYVCLAVCFCLCLCLCLCVSASASASVFVSVCVFSTLTLTMTLTLFDRNGSCVAAAPTPPSASSCSATQTKPGRRCGTPPRVWRSRRFGRNVACCRARARSTFPSSAWRRTRGACWTPIPLTAAPTTSSASP